MAKPGRPSIDPNDPSVPVNVSLPSKQLKAVSDKAKQDRMKPHDWIRQALKDALNKSA